MVSIINNRKFNYVNINDFYNKYNEYLQWQINNGKLKKEVKDIYVKKDGEVIIEKRDVWVIHNTLNNWKEFCKLNNHNCNGADFLVVFK